MAAVSVIVPNYNHAAYLERRIESILRQTYQDFELILMDDCSSDNSRDILKRYASHPSVSHLVINDVNSGSPFLQWKKGISLATGHYIWIAESDDWCESVLLETAMQGFKRDTCTVAYVQSYAIDQENDIQWVSTHHKLSEYLPGKEFISSNMLFRNSIFNASMAVFRRAAFEKISDDFTTFRFCGDWIFWSEIALQGDVFVSGKVLNFFRKHSADVSGNMYISGYNFVEELRLISFLLNKKAIIERQYERALIGIHRRYREVKRRIKRDQVEEIETLFYRGMNERYQNVLKNDYRIFRLKKRLRSILP